MIELQQNWNKLLLMFQTACYEGQINFGPVFLKHFPTTIENKPDLTLRSAVDVFHISSVFT